MRNVESGSCLFDGGAFPCMMVGRHRSRVVRCLRPDIVRYHSLSLR